MGFWECLKSVGKILHGNTYRWSMMKKSSVSRMQRFMYSQILCYVLERWIRTQHQILFGNSSWVASKIHHNTKLWTLLTENRWNSSEIFYQDSLHCSSSKKSKSSWTKWANQNNSKDESSSCRCSMTSCGELKTMKRNVLLIPHLCRHSQKDFQQDVGHSSNLGQRQSGIPLTKEDQEENGTESLNWWWSKRKQTASFPSHESIVSRNDQKQRRWEFFSSFLCRWEYDWNFFFAQLFLLISSVSVNSILPIQQNSMKNGYDENNNYNMSDETRCEINYSIITNNKWDVNTHNNMQLTMHNTYTNDDVHTDACVVHSMRWARTQRALFHTWCHLTPHWLKSWVFS